MSDSAINLRAMLAAKMGEPATPGHPSSTPSEISLSTAAATNDPRSEQEESLRKEVSLLKAELSRVRSLEVDRQQKKYYGLVGIFQELFPDLYGPVDLLEDAKLYADLREGTRETDLKITMALEQVAAHWLTELSERREELAKWPKEELELRDAQIAEMKKHPQALAQLNHHHISYWHQIEPYRHSFVIHQDYADSAGVAAWRAIRLAEASVQKGAPPTIIGFAFLSAVKAKETFDNLYRALSSDLVNELARCVVSADGYLKYKLAEASKSQGARSSSDSDDYAAGGHGASDVHATGGSSVRDADWDDWMPALPHQSYDPYGAVNPASGLPMSGPGSPFDIHGNVFGSNDMP
jgi:hypothetical protein